MLQLLEVRALAAPNIWAAVSVLECRLVCEPISDDRIENVFRRVQRLPRSTSAMERRRFSSPAHAIVELALVLQRHADCAVAFSDVRPTSFPHVWQLAFEIEHESIGRAALEAACRLLVAAARDNEFDAVDQIAQVRRVAERDAYGGTTRVLAAAARRQNIPVYRLDSESLIQLGQGATQHRLRMAATDRTSFIAEWISRDKLLTKQLLQKAGLPVAAGRLVLDADDACRAAGDIGGVVVVKPCDADFGRGVSVELTDPSEIRGAYEFARSYSANVLVETYLPGYWHRLLVVNGELVAALRKEPPCVIGDGRRTIAELIDEFNADPRRGFGDEFQLDPLIVGATVLGMLYRQGYSLQSVPPSGFTVLLRPDAYLSTGATQTDVTEGVHPEIAEMAVAAAEIIGLDIAGVDLICEDVSRPPAAQPLGVLEVNAEPSIVMHLAPISNSPRPVAERIVASLFPQPTAGRIPVIGVVNDGALARRLADQLQAAGMTVGLAARDLASVNSKRIGRRELTVHAAAETVWRHRRVTAAVVHFSLADVLRAGLPVDQCDLLCLAGLDDAVSSEIERVLQLLLQSAHAEQTTLVNFDQAGIRQYLSRPAAQSVLVSERIDGVELRRHQAAGGKLMTQMDGQIVLMTRAETSVLSTASSDTPLFHAAAEAWIRRLFPSGKPDLAWRGSALAIA